jgi:putative ABC transport system substrate-binding protein
MKRRGILGAVSAVVLWPHATRAQRAGLPVVGYLDSTSYDTFTSSRATAFRRGLEQAGFVEGRNVALEFVRADGQYDRLPALAEGLVRRPVAAILAASLPSALAAKAATSTIPIVFVMGADPVALKIVDSLGRPGTNATGVSQFYGALGGKRLEILRELVPGTGLIAILCNRKNPNTPFHLTELERAAGALGQKIEVISASSLAEIDAAFGTMMQHGTMALLLADDPFFRNEPA